MDDEKATGTLSDVKVPVRMKLSALWASLMFCYVYGDLFGFFKQTTIADVASGKAGFIGTQTGLLVSAIVVTIPALMVFLSLALRPGICRWSNVSLGLLYTVIILATMPGAWMFYQFLGVVEAALSLLIAWYAWNWPSTT